MKLSRSLRNELIQQAHKIRRDQGETDPVYIADYLAGDMLDNPEKYGTADIDATEISDYAYGVAKFAAKENF